MDFFTRNSPAGQGRAEGKGTMTISNCSHKSPKSTSTQKQFRDISCWQAPGVGLTIQTLQLYTYLEPCSTVCGPVDFAGRCAPKRVGTDRLTHEELCKKKSFACRFSRFDLQMWTFETGDRINRFGSTFRIPLGPDDSTATSDQVG